MTYPVLSRLKKAMTELKEKISALRPGYDYDEFHDVVKIIFCGVGINFVRFQELTESGTGIVIYTRWLWW